MYRMRPQLSHVMTSSRESNAFARSAARDMLQPSQEVLLTPRMGLHDAGHRLPLVALGDAVEQVDRFGLQVGGHASSAAARARPAARRTTPGPARAGFSRSTAAGSRRARPPLARSRAAASPRPHRSTPSARFSTRAPIGLLVVELRHDSPRTLCSSGRLLRLSRSLVTAASRLFTSRSAASAATCVALQIGLFGGRAPSRRSAAWRPACYAVLLGRQLAAYVCNLKFDVPKCDQRLERRAHFKLSDDLAGHGT